MADTPAVDTPASKPVLAKTEPEADTLLQRAQAKVPHITRELCAKHGLGDEYLERLASGLEPGPPNTGPNPTVDLHYTSGMWMITPIGVDPADTLEGKYR
jgi:hypothetical protein